MGLRKHDEVEAGVSETDEEAGARKRRKWVTLAVLTSLDKNDEDDEFFGSTMRMKKSDEDDEFFGSTMRMNKSEKSERNDCRKAFDTQHCRLGRARKGSRKGARRTGLWA